MLKLINTVSDWYRNHEVLEYFRTKKDRYEDNRVAYEISYREAPDSESKDPYRDISVDLTNMEVTKENMDSRVPFRKDELEMFYGLGFKLLKEFEESTGQNIEDWF